MFLSWTRYLHYSWVCVVVFVFWIIFLIVFRVFFQEPVQSVVPCIERAEPRWTVTGVRAGRCCRQWRDLYPSDAQRLPVDQDEL